MRDGSLMELLYADDLVLCGKPLNEAMDKYAVFLNHIDIQQMPR